MTDDELAAFLTKAAAVYFDRRSLDGTYLTEAIRELDSYNLLSLQALAAIVGQKYATVRRIARPRTDRPRGALNPAYIGYLGLLLSQKQLVPELFNELLAHGTSVSTIVRLTNVPQATLYRWRNRD